MTQSEPEQSSALAGLGGTAVTAARYRHVLGHYTTGVVVIAAFDGQPVGMSVNSFTSVSLDPPLVSFCAASTSSTWPRINRTGRFSVNVLNEGQAHLSRRFSAKADDRFRHAPWGRGGNGSPILDDVVAWLECDIETTHTAGDHVIVIGRVVDLDANGGPPLVFSQAEYGAFRRADEPQEPRS